MTPEDLIQRYLRNEVSAEESTRLEALLKEDPSLRQRFVREAQNDAFLREVALEREAQGEPEPAKIVRGAFRSTAWMAAAAAVGVMATLGWSEWSKPEEIATLVSTEDASWESSLPTLQGSRLTAGYFRMSSGMATFRFDSGAEMVVQAPAKFSLKDEMHVKLVSGIAMLDVPESAVGFKLETPDGYAIDLGTRFAARVVGKTEQSDFEVMEGEISVHHPASGDEVYLTSSQGAMILDGKLTTFDEALEEARVETQPGLLRIGTKGKATTVIRSNKRDRGLDPEMLMVKRSLHGTQDRKFALSFDLTEVDLDRVEGVRLRLNQVPSGIGYAWRLPKFNRFAVRGLINPEKSDWAMDGLWEDFPTAEDGAMLGKFSLLRGVQRGPVEFESEALLDFLKQREGEVVTLYVERETSHVDGEGVGLVHAFAADAHPEAAGPMLEFDLTPLP